MNSRERVHRYIAEMELLVLRVQGIMPLLRAGMDIEYVYGTLREQLDAIERLDAQSEGHADE